MKSNCSSEPAGDGTVSDSMLLGLRKSCIDDEYDALLLLLVIVITSEEMLFDLYKSGGYFKDKLGDVDGGGKDKGDAMSVILSIRGKHDVIAVVGAAAAASITDEESSEDS